MDWYPLLNSLRIAAISCVMVFFAGIFFAYYAAKLPRAVKGILDVILTLPMVLPPTVCGYFLLLIFGAKRPVGAFLLQYGIKFAMNWYGGIVIDRLWVGHSRFWVIPGTEPIPFVQTWPQVLRKRGILSVIWLAGAAIVAVIAVML